MLRERADYTTHIGTMTRLASRIKAWDSDRQSSAWKILRRVILMSWADLIAAFFLAIASPSEAQTGHDLLTLCISKSAVEQMSCKLYIAGFVHGMQASDDLQGEVCVPKTLTGNDATMIFTETLANIELAAALGKGIGRDANPFFRGPQNSALAAALAIKFKCAKKPSAK
jgi:hypothetical protein